MFWNPFKRRKAPQLITARLNARLLPMHRGEHFEDPLADVLEEAEMGTVSGGGTLMAEDGEITWCELELELSAADHETVTRVCGFLDDLGAPKGSKLITADGDYTFGSHEGLAIYLNGSELPTEVYKTCDVNFVLAEFERLLGDRGKVLSYWEGPRETALYMYGPSFAAMKGDLADFIASYPLCQKSRLEQVA